MEHNSCFTLCGTSSTMLSIGKMLLQSIASDLILRLSKYDRCDFEDKDTE